MNNIQMNKVLLKASSNQNLYLKTIILNQSITFNNINFKTKSINNMLSIKSFKIIVQRNKIKFQMHPSNIKVAIIKLINQNKLIKIIGDSYHMKNRKWIHKMAIA